MKRIVFDSSSALWLKCGGRSHGCIYFGIVVHVNRSQCKKIYFAFTLVSANTKLRFVHIKLLASYALHDLNQIQFVVWYLGLYFSMGFSHSLSVRSLSFFLLFIFFRVQCSKSSFFAPIFLLPFYRQTWEMFHFCNDCIIAYFALGNGHKTQIQNP